MSDLEQASSGTHGYDLPADLPGARNPGRRRICLYGSLTPESRAATFSEKVPENVTKWSSSWTREFFESGFRTKESEAHMQPGSYVITGASSGIGRATALLLAETGASIAILDVNDAAAAETAAACLELGAADARAYPCDVTDENQVADVVARVQADLGSPTRLFANAGIDRGGLTHELELELWQSVIETNLTGTFLICKHVLKVMVDAGDGGSIVCTSSPGGFVAFAAGSAAAYSASKGAVSSLVRSLAIDYASHGIRVNAIVPGPTETPLMWASVPEEEREAVRRTVSAETPLGRLADPSEPARAVRWLLSDEASYVTGSHLVCDGGVLAKAALSV